MNYGHIVANRRYPASTLGVCEGCELVPATLRHHVNEDPFDNRRENVWFLCRACHGLQHLVTACKHGHEYTPENTYINSQGRRVCRVCRTRSARAYAARKKEQTCPN